MKEQGSLHQFVDPYSSVPCIAAIGFSGTQVWKNGKSLCNFRCILHVIEKQTYSDLVFFPSTFLEGFIAAEDIASSLEKAWLGLHIQVLNTCFLLLMVFFVLLYSFRLMVVFFTY